MSGAASRAERDEGVHDHFEHLEAQSHAARLGVWIFLASEVLLFGALFALFLSYRAHYPAAFRDAVLHNTKVLGSINTAVLLTSSLAIACAVHALRAGKTKLAGALTATTILLGLAFLGIKLTEYGRHFAEGITPGPSGRFFVEHPARGASEFWTMYYAMTGLHAVHVTIGLTVLSVLLLQIARGKLGSRMAYRLELGATYWHLVDVVWIFLWPLLYLA